MSYGLVRRLSAAARSVVIEPPGARRRPLRLADVQPGWAVLDIDGRRVGRVAVVDVGGGLLIVAGGLLRGRALVPSDRIAELVDGSVRLALRSAEIAWRRRSPAPR